jgi:hypothetical protein
MANVKRQQSTNPRAVDMFERSSNASSFPLT